MPLPTNVKMSGANPLGPPPGARPRSPQSGKPPVPEETLDVVEELLRDCQPLTVILKLLAPQFGVSRSTVRYWIEKVHERWAEERDKIRPLARERMRAAFEAFHQKCLATGDMKSAALALDRLARLDGCFEEKIKVSAEILTGNSFKSTDDVRSRMSDLLNKPEIQAKLAEVMAGDEPESSGE